MSTDERLAALASASVSIWLDDLSRERLASGNPQKMITGYSVVGVTTNPTIFAAALSNGHVYDAQVREPAAHGASYVSTPSAGPSATREKLEGRQMAQQRGGRPCE